MTLQVQRQEIRNGQQNMSMVRMAGFWVDEGALEERFVLASGPGGQNVNKVATAVQLRFDVAHSNLPDTVAARLRATAGHRMTKDGILVLDARRFRSQERNRQDARERLIELLVQAAVVPQLRKATKPTRASKRKRLERKSAHAAVKRLRRRPPTD